MKDKIDDIADWIVGVGGIILLVGLLIAVFFVIISAVQFGASLFGQHFSYWEAFLMLVLILLVGSVLPSKK